MSTSFARRACIAPLLAAGLFGPLSCDRGDEGQAAAGPVFAVRWPLTGKGGVPDEVRTIVARFYPLDVPDANEPVPDGCNADCIEVTRDIGGLGADPDGTRRIGFRGLPRYTPFRAVFTGLRADGEEAYIGMAGPLTLAAGERRFIALAMYPLGSAHRVDRATLPGRLLHTATPLPDGRVLIAGGFDRVTTFISSVEGCPANPGPDEDRCFRMRATRDAYVFDPATGHAVQLRRSLALARAAHTATRLPDGRVLIAGGTPEALLRLARPTSAPELRIERIGTRPHASFEVFDPYANAGTQPPPDRREDLARGAFLGIPADNTRVGSLHRERTLHAAAALLDAAGRPTGKVLLLGGGLVGGGIDAGGVAGSWELFDNEKSGGYGILALAPGPLRSARRRPALVAVPGEAYAVGATRASANRDLAEVFTESENAPFGATRTLIPPVGGAPDPAPQYDLHRPIVHAMGSPPTHLLVIGWAGPRCTLLALDFGGAAPCGPPAAGETPRSYLYRFADGQTTPLSLPSAPSFAASAQLDDGSVLLTGGTASADFAAASATFRLGPDLTGEGVPALRDSPALLDARIFHTTTRLPLKGALTLGGLRLIGGGTSVAFSATVEVLFAR